MQSFFFTLVVQYFNLSDSDGYSMMDIRYTWSKGKDSVGLNGDLELPQFKVVGYKQEQKEVKMTTGLLNNFKKHYNY